MAIVSRETRYIKPNEELRIEVPGNNECGGMWIVKTSLDNDGYWNYSFQYYTHRLDGSEGYYYLYADMGYRITGVASISHQDTFSSRGAVASNTLIWSWSKDSVQPTSNYDYVSIRVLNTWGSTKDTQYDHTIVLYPILDVDVNGEGKEKTQRIVYNDEPVLHLNFNGTKIY